MPLESGHGNPLPWSGRCLRAQALQRGVTRLGSVSASLVVVASLVAAQLPFEPSAHEAPLPPCTSFIRNAGQWPEAIRFQRRVPGGQAVFTDEGWSFLHSGGRSPDAAARFTFVDARPGTVAGEDPLPAVHSYFMGNDPSAWRSRVPNYAGVRYSKPWPGIDVVFRTAEGGLKYDILVEPAARLESVVIRCEGVLGLSIDTDGCLRIATPSGDVIQDPPKSWEVLPSGATRPLPCTFRLLSPDAFGFLAPTRDASRPLVIDPGIEWSTLFGGTAFDIIHDVAIHPLGIVVTGSTTSMDFPATAGAWSGLYSPVQSAYVALLDATGSTLLAASFLGGTSNFTGSRGYSVLIGSTGDVFVVGTTDSAAFPTTPGAFMTSISGGLNCFPFGVCPDFFVARLDSTLSTLLASTFLGGNNDESFAPGYLRGIVGLTAGDAIAITGLTRSTDFPTTPGAYDATFNGGTGDAFVTVMDPSLSTLSWSTYLGTPGADWGRAVAVSPAGEIAVTGVTYSSAFPTTGLPIPALGVSDAFLAVFSPAGALTTSIPIGGSDADDADAVIPHPAGGFVIAGSTRSADFPTTPGSYASNFPGGAGTTNAYVCWLNPLPVWSTYLGGSLRDNVNDLVIESSGGVTIFGYTESQDFPTTTGSVAPISPGSWNTYVSRLDPTGARLIYSTYLGGSNDDQPGGMVPDGSGSLLVCGRTQSNDFPTTPGAYATIPYNSIGNPIPSGDGFLTRLDLLPTGVSRFGTAVTACAPGLYPSVIGMPTSPNPLFSLTCTGAPPATQGLLVFGQVAVPSGITTAGVTLYFDPSGPWFAVPLTSDPLGYVEVPTPIPPGLVGQSFVIQFGWANTSLCGGAGTLSTSSALLAILQ